MSKPQLGLRHRLESVPSVLHEIENNKNFTASEGVRQRTDKAEARRAASAQASFPSRRAREKTVPEKVIESFVLVVAILAGTYRRAWDIPPGFRSRISVLCTSSANASYLIGHGVKRFVLPVLRATISRCWREAWYNTHNL